MKIVHFIPLLTKGGAERVVIDLANEAVRRGHVVSIVAWRPVAPDLGTAALSEGIQIRYLDAKGRSLLRAYVGLFPWVIANRKWLLAQDVIHSHLSMGSVFAAAVQLMRRLSRVRSPAVIETYHAVGVAIPKFDRSVHARLLSRRDAVAFMAEDAYWTRYRSARRHRLFRTIPNGVSFPAAADRASSERYRREKAKIPDGAIVLGSVGRLVPERRPDLLLDTFDRLTKRTDKKIHLLLAGEGSVRGVLKEDARRRGLGDRVHLPGLIVNPVEAFGIIDFYLTINVGAITGIAALEAASVGLPIAAIQLDPSHERDQSEWIWASSDPQALADHVADLLDHPTRLKQLARRQRSYAISNHSVGAMADAYERLYQEALDARRMTRAT